MFLACLRLCVASIFTLKKKLFAKIFKVRNSRSKRGQIDVACPKCLNIFFRNSTFLVQSTPKYAQITLDSCFSTWKSIWLFLHFGSKRGQTQVKWGQGQNEVKLRSNEVKLRSNWPHLPKIRIFFFFFAIQNFLIQSTPTHAQKRIESCFSS